jgi:CBS domain-containing protein
MGNSYPVNGENSPAVAMVPSSACKKTKAKDIASYNVVTIDKTASVYDAIGLLLANDITGLPVVDDSRLVGIISEKDTLRLLCNGESIEGTVGDYMTTKVQTFDEETDLSVICRCLMENNFRRVPILRKGKLAAIITRADLIMANKDKFRPETMQEDSPVKEKCVVAEDVMKSVLYIVRRTTSIYEAINILASRNLTALPVVDEFMVLLGIISEKDMLELLYDPQAQPGLVQEYMTEEVIGFAPGTPLNEICDCLVKNSFRRVPILDRGKLVGVISRSDIMAYIMKNRMRVFSQTSKK